MSYFINKKFNTFGDALTYVLNERGLKSVWLAERLASDSITLNSAQSMLSRWRSGSSIGPENLEKVNKELNINIHQLSSGKWMIKELSNKEGHKKVKKSESTNVNYEEMPIDRLERELYDRIESEGVPWNAMGLLLEALEDEAGKLQKDMKGLTERIRKIRILNRKKHSDD